MSNTDESTCWLDGPKHDWAPEGDGWECDRCGRHEED